MRLRFAGQPDAGRLVHAERLQAVQERLLVFTECALDRQRSADVRADLENLLGGQDAVPALVGVGIRHAPAVERNDAIARVDFIVGFHATAFHGGNQGRQFERGSGFYGRADGVVEGLLVHRWGVVRAFLGPGQVGHGADFTCRHLHQNDGAPRGVVFLKLPTEGIARDVLQMHVDAADDVVPGHGLDDVVIRDRHPLPAGDAALQLATGHTGELIVPAGLQADPVFIAVDADGSAGQVAKRLAALLNAREGEAALEPATSDERQLDQLLLLDVRNATGDEGIPAAHVASVAQNFPVFSGAFVAQHFAQPSAQVIELAIEGVPIDGFAFAVPPHFKDGY